MTQPFLFGEGWMQVLDGDPAAEAMYMRHYSRKPGRRAKGGLIVGPGYKLLLVWHDGTALFAWRREMHRRDTQTGVNCAVFRNEGRLLSSDLIRQADEIADRRWPGERHFTFVDAEKTASRRSKAAPPGACFIHAGWRPCGHTALGLHILERPAACGATISP
jgi:hypothetical protein